MSFLIKIQILAFYVCMEAALCGITHCSRAVQLGLGEGPIGVAGPISQPRGIIDTVSRVLDHTCAINVRFLNQLTVGS